MEIPHFNRCNPTEDKFNDVVKLKTLQDWNIEYVELDHGIGYWIADNPFYENGFDIYRNLVSKFPIVKDTNLMECIDANPFASIHLPPWMWSGITHLMEDYFIDKFPLSVSCEYSEWGNLYFPEEAKPYNYFRVPHQDGAGGIVGNLWFTDHDPSVTGTSLYKYHGAVYQGDNKSLFYDFQVDTNHPLFDECMESSLSNLRLDKWKPLTDEEEKYWGFEKVGIIPCIEGKITCYNTDTPHSPYITESCPFRWSHVYSIYFNKLL